MITAPFHPKEQQRIEELMHYDVLDTEGEQAFDELTQLASAICGTSISLISLVDEERQWFKSRVGLDATETPRDLAFCAHAILQEGVFEVCNAKEDERFSDNPLVTQDPDISFYAGAPLVSPSGMPIGTLCVIDQQPKKLSAQQSQALTTLAHQVISQLELRLHNRQLMRMQKEQEQFFAAMAHDLRSPFSGILGLSKMLAKKADTISSEQLQVASKAILDSSMNVYQLLDELLQWSRNQLGAVHVKLQALPIQGLLDDSMDLIQDPLALKDLTLKQDIPGDLKAMVDQDLAKMIIRNLLANAIKYSPQGKTISLEVKSDGEHVILSVQDQGSGVSESLKAQLFNECVSSEQGSSGEIGHGLGLKLCSEFAKKLGGQLSIDEHYQDGAKFILKLKSA